MVERPFITKRFVHHVEQLGKHVLTVTYDLQIPLPNPNCAPADLFGHLLTQNRLPLPFHEEVRVKFETFVRDETRKFDAELASIRIEKALNTADEKLNDSLVAGSANSGIDTGGTIANCDANRQGMPLSVAKTNGTDEGEPLFEEQFQHLMRNASVVKLTQLVTEESRMTEEMRALVRARNFEVERIKCACEQTLAQSVVDNATEFDKHSYQISMLNEKLRQVTVNYSNQIEALNERQRHEYRQLVNALNANNLSGCGEKKNEVAASPSVNSLSGADTLSVCQTPASTSASEQQPPHSSSTRLFRKSLSCDSKLAALQQEPIGKESNAFVNIRRQPATTTAQCRSESFTIYIGAQLKTMHNARILTCDQLVDLLTMDTFTTNSSSNKSDTANGTRRSANLDDHRTNANAIVCHSQRLQLLMNLYRRELACAVLIVDGSDPLWHVKERTKFAQLCEQSAELHFDSLERQLMKIEQEVRNANRERRAATVRRRRRQQQQQQQRDRDGDDAEERAAADPATMAPAAETSALSSLVMASYNDSMDANELTHFVEGEDRHPNTVGEEDNIDYGDVNSLRPGDVYVTCHSNLSAVQVVFHVVGDRQLLEQDISSRHPCIGALRNVIRLAPHSAVHHVTFPLLLVEYMSETMTISWCLSRAELVFKCLKGFLMEVCSSGVSTAIAGGGSAVVGALSGNAGGTPHFNINFVVPSAISPALFHHLVELFSSIFHPIPSLNATQQQ